MMNNDQAEVILDVKQGKISTAIPDQITSIKNIEPTINSEKDVRKNILDSTIITINEENISNIINSSKDNVKKSDESSDQDSSDHVMLDMETPLLNKNKLQDQYVTFLDIFGQSLEVLPAIPSAAFAGLLVPDAAELTGNSVSSKIFSGALIPPGIATAVFTLVGTAVYLFKGFEKSKEENFKDYLAKNIDSLPAFMGKLYVTGGGAFSLYVLCGELAKLYVLPKFSIGLAAGGLVTGLPATVLGVAAFIFFNKVTDLKMPAEKIMGIASIFLGLTLGNFTVEYCHGALTDLLGKAVADSSPFWLPALVTAGVAPTGNTIGHLMQMRGMFKCGENKSIEANENDVRIDINSESKNETINEDVEKGELGIREANRDTIIDFDKGTVTSCCW